MEKFKNTCAKLKDTISPEFKWEADDRFNTALISFDKGVADSIQETLSNLFENQFNSKTIKKATKQEKKLAKSLSGLSKEQLLFTSNGEELTLFGAWWPWGNSQKVSLRIGLFTLEKGLIEEEDVRKHLAEWFGV